MAVDLASLKTPSLLELYRETGDVQYAALAIGRNVTEPPEWALWACATFFQEVEVAVPAPKSGRPPKYPIQDGLLLRLVADLVVNEGMSRTKAVMRVTGEGTDGTNFRRLMRHWKNDLRPMKIQPASGKTRKTNRWLDQARLRAYGRFVQGVFREARAEIEAGNTDVSLDLGKLATKRLRFSKELDEQQEAWIEIREIDRPALVETMKQWLLENSEHLDDEGESD